MGLHGIRLLGWGNGRRVATLKNRAAIMLRIASRCQDEPGTKVLIHQAHRNDRRIRGKLLFRT